MPRLRITLDGERITDVEPIVGFMHRGAEKLFEARDYRQIIVLANRHDWLSAFSNELGVVLDMEVPVRAVWARTLLAELNRVPNHLMFLGSYPIELGAITPIFYAFRDRPGGSAASARRSNRTDRPRGDPHGRRLPGQIPVPVRPGTRDPDGRPCDTLHVHGYVPVEESQTVQKAIRSTLDQPSQTRAVA